MMNFPPNTVSPGDGMCSARTTMSVLELPTTTIFGRGISHLVEFVINAES
jgi:hypothetical protein